MDDLKLRVERDFTLHPPASEEARRLMDSTRYHFKQLALICAETLPAGREQSLSITKLEEACFYAIASIARNQEEG